MSNDARIVGPRIEELDEELRRVVSALKSKGDQPGRGAFVPTKSAFKPSSDGGLSTKRAAQPPAEVLKEYVALGKRAAGVWGVRVGAFEEVGGRLGHELPTHADGGLVPAGGGEPYPQYHASVWYPIDEAWTASAERRHHERIASTILGSIRQLHPEITSV